MNGATYEDAFNLLCGKLLGEGIHRKIFECRLRDDLVVKVEAETDWRYFANVLEMRFWNDHEHYKKVADWLAPCEYLSPDGRILLQRRASPIIERSVLPEQVPAFLSDLKPENFGMLDGRLVCLDYALTISNPLNTIEESGLAMSNVYRENGYNDREDYLSCMAEDYGLDLEQVVRPLADLLGPNEDFDGLVSALEDEASK